MDREQPYWIWSLITVGGLLALDTFILYLHLTSYPEGNDDFTLALIVIISVTALIPFARSVSFPGGGGIVFERALKKAEELNLAAAHESSLPSEVKSAVPKSSSLVQGAPEWEGPVQVSFRESLIRTRFQIEERLRTLATLAGISPSQGPLASYAMVSLLASAKALSVADREAVLSLLEVCNMGIHSRNLTMTEAERTATIAMFTTMLLDQRIRELEAKRK
jgi:hypothetical protein